MDLKKKKPLASMLSLKKYLQDDTYFSDAFWSLCLTEKNKENEYEYKWNLFIVNVPVNRPR